MSLSMSTASVPVMIRVLGNLAAILEKGAASCEARKIDPAVMVNGRLAPDMFPLKKQVQLASDIAKAGGARLSGQEPPSYEDTEASLPELVERLKKTIAFLEGVDRAKIDGSEARAISWKARDTVRTMEGYPYLFHYILPNLYFHAGMAYAILRHNGVEVGKLDWLGKL